MFIFWSHFLEKILKALVVEETKKHAPHIHDLERLSQLTKLNFSSDELDFLAEMNEFNIRARYHEKKLKLYRICNSKYTKNVLDKIDLFYKNLCQPMKPKKS